MSAPGSLPGLRERKKLKLKTMLTDAALRLFIANGFEATTVNDIVAEVDVSPRTFFRYFDSKEDVIVAFSDELGAELLGKLAARPRDEPPLTAVHHALSEIVDRYDADRELTLALIRLMDETPAIRARHLDKQTRWQQGLAKELAPRLGARSPNDLLPRLISAVALGALDTALATWSAGDGRKPLSTILDEAFAAVAGGLDQVPTRRRVTRKR